ncbi:Prp18 domain-containing protein [Coniochaeta sp. 2T2.1]|nr:Prp18 domain-containing protein [Coniochaeta sp. 2T2.1]
MDFASLMAKTLSKSSTPTSAPAAPPASKDTPSTNPDTNKSPTPPPPPPAAPKFISRREAEEARRAAYLAEQQRIEAERQARQNAKRKREEELAEEAKARELKRQKLAEESRRRREEKEAEEERQRRKRLGLPEVAPAQQQAEPQPEEEWSDSEGALPTLPDSDVRSKLRDMGEPVVLFGEAEAARLKRYHKLTGKGLVAPNGPVPTTLPPVQEKDMKVGAVPPLSDRKARRYLYRQLASYFNMVLREWERALAEEGTHDTTAGKQAVAAMLSSKESMKALFRKFEKADLDESILIAIVEIVQAAQERRYVDANDGYLRLSIGKAAWPIGVTMVGIHERSAREKLHNGEKGHVMGDEVTRKYLQSIKRCLTFAQVRWPPEDVRQLMG